MLEKLNARASIQDVTRVIKSAGVPRQITQQPFDFDPGHYWRLCNLGNNQASAADLYDYALDLTYMELQPELLRHLTPILLTAWRRNLFKGAEAGYVGFVEQFWSALLTGNALTKIYSVAEKNAFVAYMRNSILDRLDAEDLLHFSGMGASPYDWIQALVSYGILFSDIDILWSEWWQMKTSGHAVAAFQYTSALMYEDDKNPVFDAWTRDKGGGSPALWESGAMLFSVGWKNENLDFLKSTLSVDYFDQKLQLAFSQIKNKDARRIASGILEDFPGLKTRLELRIGQLPDLLKDVSQANGFII